MLEKAAEWVDEKRVDLAIAVTGKPDPFETQRISPVDLIHAIHETVERNPIFYGLLPKKLVDDFCVKVIKRLYGWDFSKKAMEA